MKSNIVAFDIETIVDPEEFKSFPEEEVKTGNTKDPEKIKAKQAEAEAKRIESAGLNKFVNLVCVFSWADGEKASGCIIETDNGNAEREVLQYAWETLNRYDHFVSFNGIEFDVPILNLHSMFRKLRPSVNISTDRYRIKNHTDLRNVFSGGDRFAPGKLDYFLSRCLGRGKKPGMNGGMVQSCWDVGLKEDILEYGIQDAVDTFELFQYAREYFPGIG